MFAPSLTLSLLCSAVTFVASASLQQGASSQPGNMNTQSASLVNSLALPSSQAKAVTSKLENDSNLAAFLNGGSYVESGLVTLACYVLQACLGAASVDTTPVSPTEVDANWFVVSSAQTRQKLIILFKVGSVLEYSNMCRTSRISGRCVDDTPSHQFPPNQIRRS